MLVREQMEQMFHVGGLWWVGGCTIGSVRGPRGGAFILHQMSPPHGAGGLAACLLQWPWGPGAQTGDPFFGGSGTALKDEPDWIHATESFIHLYVTA